MIKKAPRGITIVVADDHPVVLHGIAAILAADPNIEVLATCPTGGTALAAIRKYAPTVALLDLSMPDLDGLEVLSALSTGRQTKVVLLTANASDGQILTAIARGIKGILLKDAAVPDLISCVREVAAGGHWLPSDLIDAVLERETGRRMIGMRLAESLTSRERQIMSAVAEGVSNKVIAKRLGVSEGTVKIHLHHIYRKVDVANRTSLAALAIAHRDQLSGTEYPACSSPPRKNA